MIPESVGFIDFENKYIYIESVFSLISVCVSVSIIFLLQRFRLHTLKAFHFAQCVSSAVFFILSLFLSFFLLLHGGACGILVPPPVIEPTPPTAEVQSPRP